MKNQIAFTQHLELEEALKFLGLKIFAEKYQEVAQTCDKLQTTHVGYVNAI